MITRRATTASAEDRVAARSTGERLLRERHPDLVGEIEECVHQVSHALLSA
jgi:hypothetical protein